MTFSIPTRYDELVLRIEVKTQQPEKIRVVVKDKDMAYTTFTNRWKTVNGNAVFFVRMPVSGQTAIVEVYNEKNGNLSKGQDTSFDVVDIQRLPLEKKVDVVDFSNPKIKSFINFATKFAFNLGELKTGFYTSNDDVFKIELLPTITHDVSGKVLNTPARISQTSGKIQVSKEKFMNMTIPMRMAILLHEFSHYYVNDNMRDETEADLNGLLIYLGLGYPRIEAHEAFLTTFINVPTKDNKHRYDMIKQFIDDFEKNNIIVNE